MTDDGRAAYREGFRALVSEVLEEPVEPTDNFVDAGGDSLTAAVLVNVIVERDGFVPPIIWFFEAETVTDIADRCFDARSAAPAAG
ncbi:acyl carrier protein [Dactylosporangium sp. NPDC051485]|uniref:acyl carrier protein n=1 Tax=Dactylosporangium sp. NPDC051485 TaxID=3154846 RepID=UPI00342BBAAE